MVRLLVTPLPFAPWHLAARRVLVHVALWEEGGGKETREGLRDWLSACLLGTALEGNLSRVLLFCLDVREALGVYQLYILLMCDLLNPGVTKSLVDGLILEYRLQACAYPTASVKRSGSVCGFHLVRGRRYV